MYSTYTLETYQGAFFGSVEANGHKIYIKNYEAGKAMFEACLATLPLASY